MSSSTLTRAKNPHERSSLSTNKTSAAGQLVALTGSKSDEKSTQSF